MSYQPPLKIVVELYLNRLKDGLVWTIRAIVSEDCACLAGAAVYIRLGRHPCLETPLMNEERKLWLSQRCLAAIDILKRSPKAFRATHALLRAVPPMERWVYLRLNHARQRASDVKIAHSGATQHQEIVLSTLATIYLSRLEDAIARKNSAHNPRSPL